MFLTATAGHPVLHPRYKLEYFKRHKWDEASIDAARDLLQDKFDQSYWLLDIDRDTNVSQVNGDTTATVSCSFYDLWYIHLNVMLNTGINLFQTQKHV
jgi:hypothetical protein